MQTTVCQQQEHMNHPSQPTNIDICNIRTAKRTQQRVTISR